MPRNLLHIPFKLSFDTLLGSANSTLSLPKTSINIDFMSSLRVKIRRRDSGVIYIVPLAFLLDTVIFDKSRQYRWFDPISWTSVPLVYMTFALFNGFFLKIDIPKSKDNPFPYFFLNVFKKGWPYVIQMSPL